jgi:hypothetical protein
MFLIQQNAMLQYVRFSTYKFSAMSNLPVTKLNSTIQSHFRRVCKRIAPSGYYLRHVPPSGWILNLSTVVVFVKLGRTNSDCMRRITCVLTRTVTNVTWLLLCYLGEQANQRSVVSMFTRKRQNVSCAEIYSVFNIGVSCASTDRQSKQQIYYSGCSSTGTHNITNLSPRI